MEFEVDLLTGPKRHHYVPRYYQHYFSTDDRTVWTYDRKSNEYRCVLPKDTAVEGYFYCYEGADGNRRYDLEALFAKVEDYAKDSIENLAAGGSPTAKDRDAISAFVAAAFVRTPDYLMSVQHAQKQMKRQFIDAHFSTPERVAQTMKKYAAPEGVTPEEIAAYYAKCELEVDVHRNEPLSIMVRVMPKITEIVQCLNWAVMHTARDDFSFVTSDSPVTLRGRSFSDAAGFLSHGSVKVMPLTQYAALFMYDPGEQCIHTKIGRGGVKSFNYSTVLNCHRFVIGRDEALLRALVRRTGIDRFPWQPKIQVG